LKSAEISPVESNPWLGGLNIQGKLNHAPNNTSFHHEVDHQYKQDPGPNSDGEIDYLLFINQKAVGVIEAKPKGTIL
jgi:hypothetical protein